MKDLQSIISGNIKSLRRNAGLTQIGLAEKLDCSDKTISKWETGESMPGIEAAMQIAAVFGITLNDLVREDMEIGKPVSVPRNVNRLVIMLLAVSAVWIVATILFVYANLVSILKPWIVFLYAIPASCTVMFVFNALFWHSRRNYAIISVFIWSFLASVHLQYIEHNLWVLYLAGIPVQIAVILWSQLKKH